MESFEFYKGVPLRFQRVSLDFAWGVPLRISMSSINGVAKPLGCQWISLKFARGILELEHISLNASRDIPLGVQ